MKITFVNFNGVLNNTAYESQVLNFIRYQRNMGRRVDYFGVEKLNSIISNRKRYKYIVKNMKLTVKPDGRMISLPTLSYLLFPLHFFYLFIYQMWMHQKGEKVVYHCRTEASTIPVLLIKLFFPQIKIIHDARGVHLFELIAAEPTTPLLRSIIKRKIIKIFERKALQKSDEIICVSNNFEDYIKKNFDIKGNLHVIPSCVNSDYFNYSKEAKKMLCFSRQLQFRIAI